MNRINQVRAWLALAGMLVLGLIAFLFMLALKKDPHRLQSSLINTKVPVFSAKQWNQPGIIQSRRLFGGHAVLLNVFASWCANCHMEHTLWMHVAQMHQIPIIGLDYKDHSSDLSQWFSRQGNPYQAVLMDKDGVTAQLWGVYGAPETFLIDAHGMIRDKWVGVIDADRWLHVVLPEIKRVQAIT